VKEYDERNYMMKSNAQSVAALSMYDWPEVREEVDAEWGRLRDELRSLGVEAPENLVRAHKDLPSVPGGIRDAAGKVIASDPAKLPPDELHPHELWLHPALLFAQTCWGPMEFGLSDHVQVVGQPKYDGFEGGQGELYSSAIIMRAGETSSVESPSDGTAIIPLDLLRGRRFTFNDPHSMSGLLGLTRDLEVMNQTLDLFADRSQSGGHRASIIAVAAGSADVAAIDCKSFALARRFEPTAKDVTVIGWTKRRKGLPLITSRHTRKKTIDLVSKALRKLDWVIGRDVAVGSCRQNKSIVQSTWFCASLQE
jgi:ABC-type phosphate/phosphonate transport system substrate-binding protein